jgi:hypothetical protein
MKKGQDIHNTTNIWMYTMSTAVCQIFYLQETKRDRDN